MNLLGWIHPDDRTDVQQEHHAAVIASLPKFFIAGETRQLASNEKVLLTDYWKHPAVVSQLGYAFPGIRQVTGACVGAGGGNMLFTLNAVECVLRGEQEAIMVPFWLLPYGRSRYDEGDRGQGEGSMGSSFARAVKEDGVLDAADARLPKFTTDNQLCWGQSIEMKWSDGGAISGDYLSDSRQHTVKTFTQLNSAQQVWDSIVNGYPVTRASLHWCQPGSEQLKGDVVVGPYDGTGGHQESWLGVWEHPTLGKLIYEANQWGSNTYKTDPATGLGIGCWHTFSSVDQICRDQSNEVFAFSGLNGYPARELTYNLF